MTGAAPGLSRVLLVTNIFPPQIGGPATFMDALASLLTERGCRVTVVCSGDSTAASYAVDRPFRIRRVDIAARERYEVLIRAVLSYELLRHRTVFVNGLESYVAPLAAAVGRGYYLKVVGDVVWEQARNRGTTIKSIDEFQNDSGEQGRFQKAIVTRNGWVRRALGVAVPSNYLRRIVCSWGIPSERVSVIPNGVATTGASARSRAEGQPLELVFVGRLTNWKGVETILLALKGLSDVRLTVIGDGPELPHLVDLARQIGVSQCVQFAGRRDHREVQNRLLQAHALVLVSQYEGMSHTLLEGMASGLPCIASSTGGNDEVLTQESGLMVPPLNVSRLQESINYLATHEDARQRMAHAALKRAQDFRISSTVEQTVALISGTAPR